MNNNLSKLVYALSSNARLTTKKLGQLLSISQQNASYMVKSVLKKGILQNYLAVVDPARFGLINVIVLYNYKSFDKKLIDELKKDVIKNPYIVTAEDVSQGADLLLEYSIPNISFFNKKHTEFLHKHQSLIQMSNIYVVVVKHLYEKKYLVDNPSNDEVVLCGDRDVFVLNNHQKSVLKALCKNAKNPVVNIAQDLKLDSKTVVRIKKELEKQKIIVKYSIKFNCSAMDVRRRYLFIQLAKKDPEEVNKLLGFTQQHKNIVETIKVIGDHELLLVVEKKGLENRAIADLRKKFQILNYKIIESDNLFKQNYVPEE